MAEEDEDIVWIREEEGDEEGPTPPTPQTAVETKAFDIPPQFEKIASSTTLPPITVSAPEEKQEEKPAVAKGEIEFDKLSTKSSVRPPDTPTSCDSISFDISECERELNKTTTEAKELLDELDKKTRQVAENNAQISNDLTEAQKELRRGEEVMKTIDDVAQLPPPPELPTGGLPRNVESVLIGEGVVQEVTGTLVLPNGLVLATDEVNGIILFDLEGRVVAKINPPEFKRFASPIYHKEHILVLADAKDAEDHWARHILKFSIGLQYVARIECPKWLQEYTIFRERMSIAYTDHLYYCVCGEIFSGLYELTPVGQWTELEYKLSEAYVDMLAFSTIGSITQLLVVEGRRNYVLLVSVRESQIVDRRRMAICERPGALARDEAGRLFVANRYSASIQLVDTVKWVSAKNVAITDALVRHFTAAWGLLALPLKHAIRLQRYSFR